MISPQHKPTWSQKLADKIFGYDFFISYAWSDGRNYALGLANRLHQRRRACFLDSEEFIPGEGLTQATHRALKRTRVLVLVGSPIAPTRSSVQTELQIFAKTGRKIVPINIGGLDEAPHASEIARYIPDDALYIREDASHLTSLPSQETVDAVIRSFDGITQQRKRGWLIRGTLAVLTVLLIAVFISGLIAARQRNRAIAQRDSAISHANRSRANLAVSFGSQMLEADPAGAMALALHSLSLSPTQEARALVNRAIRELPSYAQWRHPTMAAQVPSKQITIFHDPNPVIRAAGFIGPTETVAILDNEGAVFLWNIGDISTDLPKPILEGVKKLVLAQDSARFAVLDYEGIVKVFELNSEAVLIEFRRLNGNYGDLALSPDGQKIVGLGIHTCIVYGEHAESKSIDLGEATLSGAFSQDGQRVFLFSESGKLTATSISVEIGDTVIETGVLKPRNSGYEILERWEKQLSAEEELTKAREAAAPQAARLQELSESLEEARAFRLQSETDILGLPLPDLTLSGGMTQLIMGLTTGEKSANTQKVNIYPGPDANTVIVAADDGYTLGIEVWDLKNHQLVFKNSGLYSKVAVTENGAHLAVATPVAGAVYTIIRNGTLKVSRKEFWRLELAAERLGEPVGIWFSPKGYFLGTAHSPSLKMEGARSSSVSLWYSEKVDSRDGNVHRGHRLKPFGSKAIDLSFAPCGKRVLTAESQGLVTVWKISNEEKLFGTNNPEHLVQFIFSGLRYTPDEAFGFLTTRFRTDAELKAAARRVSLRTLTSKEAEDLGLSPILPQAELAPPEELPLSYEWEVATGFNEGTGEFNPTFIAEFGRLLSDIRNKGLVDEVIGKRYASLIIRNPLLLSGLQIRWAKNVLDNENLELVNDAVMVLGISGDRSAAVYLESNTFVRKADPSVLRWAEGFLQRQARNSAIDFSEDPKNINFGSFLVYPRIAAPHFDLSALKLEASPSALKQAAAKLHSVKTDGSIANLVFALVVTGKSRCSLLQTIGEIARDKKDLKTAEAYAIAAVEDDSSNAGAWNLLGNIRADTGAYRMAIEAFGKCLQLGRNDGWPEYNMALVYEKLGELDAAEEMYRAALTHRETVRLPEELGTFLNGLAWFLLTRRPVEVASANEAYKLSFEANEVAKQENPDILDTMGLAAARLGRYKEAVSVQQRAVQLLTSDGPKRAKFEATLANYEQQAASME